MKQKQNLRLQALDAHTQPLYGHPKALDGHQQPANGDFYCLKRELETGEKQKTCCSHRLIVLLPRSYQRLVFCPFSLQMGRKVGLITGIEPGDATPPWALEGGK